LSASKPSVAHSWPLRAPNEDADGDHILGARQGRAHGHRAVELAVVAFGLPGFATSAGCSVEEQWRIVDDRCGCEAFSRAAE
jgi:hypothetical protein